MDYLHFKRPDGTLFHKLPTIPKRQIKAYVVRGCELLNPEASRPRRVSRKASKPASAGKEQAHGTNY